MNSRFSGALQTLAGAAVLISAVTLVSRLLGFVRSMAQATWVGTGGIAEPYSVANQLPNILFEVVAGGALAGAVVPLLAGALAKKDTDALRQAASALLTWTLAALIPLSVVVVVFAPQIVAFLASMRTDELNDAAIFFLRVFAVQIPLYGVGIVCGGVLHAHKRFLWPALAPLFSSLVVIGAYYAFGQLAQGHQQTPGLLSEQAMNVLAWGTTAGVFAMAITMAAPLASLKLKLRPTFSFPGDMGRRARNLAFAGVGALLAQQLTMIVVMRMSTSYGTPETFNLFQYSQAVYVLPYAVLVVPLATSMFPRISALAAQGEEQRFAAMSARTTKIVLVISAFAVAMLIAAAQPIEDFFATFTDGSVTGMAQAIAWSAPGLIGFSLILLSTRILYAQDHGKAAVTATAIGWLTAAVLTAVVPLLPTFRDRPELTLTIISGAQALGMTVAGILLVWAVRRCCGHDSVTGVTRTGFLAIAIAVLGAGAGAIVAQHIPEWGTPLWAAISTGVCAAGVAVAVAFICLIAVDRSLIQHVRTLRTQ
ncbi:murein biosynthesis integral membrane protein MurJ [Timonella sp. A28]|uniref:murein biosynthesis integral membrane protein MurJ n=1 Tax=Timonella sp. A28 TaxID=3442640 RepID=UPI003EB71D0A